MDYWNHVIWSDEMKINLFGSDGFKHVWRWPGEEYKDKCIMPSVKHGGGNVIVWGCMSAADVGDLYFMKYELQHVLWNTVAEHNPLPPETVPQGSVPAWQWPQTYLQDDHCFTEEAEGKGDGLPKHVFRFEPNRTSFGGSSSGRWRYVMEECMSIPVATCEALVNSMPRRVKAVLNNDGGHTKYFQLTWCMLILTTFPKGCTHFCWQGFSF